MSGGGVGFNNLRKYSLFQLRLKCTKYLLFSFYTGHCRRRRNRTDELLLHAPTVIMFQIVIHRSLTA